MRDVVEIDHGAECDRLLELVERRIVRREHDLLANNARHFRDKELGDAAAVRPRALLVQNLDNARIRQCLHREMLTKAGCPRERIAQAAAVRADLLLVVDVKRRREFFNEFYGLFALERKVLFVHIILPHVNVPHYSNAGEGCQIVYLDERRALPYNEGYLFI